MPRHRGVVLVDTNVVLEAHRSGSWRALTGGDRVETVDERVIETQTGFQLRRPEQQIDAVESRGRLGEVHAFDDVERARRVILAGNIFLDAGEAALWRTR